jgi:hypothetical protein
MADRTVTEHNYPVRHEERLLDIVGRNESGPFVPLEKVRKTIGVSQGAVEVLKMMRQPAEIGWSQVRWRLPHSAVVTRRCRA